MANEAAVTQTINIVPVQGIFQPEPTFALVTLIGPAGTPFYANINPYQSGLHITDSTIDSSPIGSITPSTGVFTNVDLTTGTITSAPSGPTSIVNQAYVDAVAQGLSFKQPANYTTTANITLSGLAVQAGGDWPATLTAGDRILVQNQSTAANNGIYVAAAGAWARASDANTYAEYLGAYLFVLSGTLYGGSAWVCTNQPGGTLGVTPITFTQFSNNALYTAGTGLTLTGYQFSITNVGTAGTYGSASQVPVFVTNAQGQVTSVTNTSISIAGSQITSGTIDSARLSGSYTGITGVGTLTAGTWNASTIGVAYGGTGVATLTAGYVKADGTNPFSTVATIPNTDITGLGTMSTQNANNVAITGGSVAVSTLKTLGLTGYLYGNDTGAVTASTTIPNTAITGLGTMSTQNANAVAITGGTITGLTQLGADYLQFNTSATVTAAVGKIWWDGGTTMNIGMTTSVTQKVGEDQYYYIKASAAITKGQVVMFTGSVGASGVITGAPATGVTDGSYIMGIAAEDMAHNAFGLVQSFGILRNINTSGYADGDILWYDPAVTGGLTKTKPSAPNIKVQMAAVVNGGSSGGGVIQVRVTAGSTLGGTDSNVEFGTLATGNLIQYNGTYWTNVTPASITGVGTALNLSGGGAGQIPYQSGASTTAFLAAGTSGQVLTSNGTSAPSWTTPTAYATVTDDTTTNATRYPLFANQTTGNITTEYVSSTKLQFNPSTGVFTATSFTGAGTGLTGTASSLSIGGNAATATSATSATTATNLDGGAANRIPYQTGAANTSFIAAPSVSNTVLTWNGSGFTWSAAAGGVTISDDTTTNATRYLTFVDVTTGTVSTEYVASTKLSFNPSTGTMSATAFSGSGASLTALNASNLSTGTVGTARLATGTANSTTFLRGDQTWAPLPYSVEAVIIAGGGSGGATNGGGGGAGGVIYVTGVQIQPSSSTTVTVGAGGAGSTSGGNNGNDSVFGIYTAVAGGAGQAVISGQSTNGGSGGGGRGEAGTAGGTATAGQGNAGGTGLVSPRLSAGGGGKGGAGQDGVSGGAGGSGTNDFAAWATATSSGVSGFFAGGGGGGTEAVARTAAGGSGGGGASGNASDGVAGTANTGSGGGGGSRGALSSGTYAGGAGGSGIVIVRYPGAQRGSGGTVYTYAGYTYHKFTSSGTYTG